MANFLAGRGFSWGVIGKVLERLRPKIRETGDTTETDEE